MKKIINKIAKLFLLISLILTTVFTGGIPVTGSNSYLSQEQDKVFFTYSIPDAPGVNNINPWLIIGMRPGGSEAVTVGSSNELGADRAVLTAYENYPGPNPSVIEGTNTNVFPKITLAGSPEGKSRALAPTSLWNKFIGDNRWVTGLPTTADSQTPEGGTYPGNAATGSDVNYLPYTYGGQVRQSRAFRGVDWSGNVAVTSASGKFSLSDISIFADLGIKSTANNAAANISNSYYFSYGSLNGVLMDSMEPNHPDSGKGWTSGADFLPLLNDLRDWRDYIRGLSVERMLTADIPGSDLENKNSKDGSGPFVYFVQDAWDSNSDGIVLIEVPSDGTDYKINSSDWVIEGTGSKLVIFRIRGQQNMLISNSSIMLGQQFREGIGFKKLGVIFAKVHPEEEFTSSSGSSDTVFDLQNAVMSGIGLWDLNTIGDAILDTKFGGNASRTNQENYTKIAHSNTQGCGQFISPVVYMQNVRWVLCNLLVTPAKARITVVKKVVSGPMQAMFDFEGEGGNGLPAEFSITTGVLTGTGSETFEVFEGTYAVDEILVGDWEYINSTIEYDSGGPQNYPRGSDLDVSAGDEVTVTFNNKVTPGVPIPELSSVVLLGLAVMGTGIFIVFRKRKNPIFK